MATLPSIPNIVNVVIDYIKIRVQDVDIDQLVKRPELDFVTILNEKTGEISQKKEVIWHHCKITIYESGVVFFSGSIHKMYNSLKAIFPPNYHNSQYGRDRYTGFNGNFFTLVEIKYIIQYLNILFDCDSSQMIVQNIEIGVNIEIVFDPQIFIKGLLYHFGVMFQYRFGGFYAQAIHERYILKIYNKSKQYGIRDPHILRIEIKVRKSEHLKSTGITTLADINQNNLDRAKDLLLGAFEGVVYYDYTIKKETLKPREKALLNNYSNPRYWLNDLEPNRRNRPKKKLKSIIEKYSDNLHSIIKKKIIQKCVIINRLSESAKCVIINSSSIGLNITHSTPRICPVTGLDISMQKEGSMLLSNTGLKHLEKNNDKEFKKLAEVLLTGHENKYEKDIYHMLSKQIRNKYYNNQGYFNWAQQNLFA